MMSVVNEQCPGGGGFELGEWGVIDIETTGLDPEQDELLEIGWLKFQGTTLVEKETYLLPYEGILPAFVGRLTGLCEKDFKGQTKDLSDIAVQLESLHGIPLLAHNADFEKKYFESRPGLQPLANCLFDTLDFFPLLCPWFKRLSLEIILEQFHLAEFEKHRALDDCLDLVRCMIAAVESFGRDDFWVQNDLSDSSGISRQESVLAKFESLPEGQFFNHFLRLGSESLEELKDQLGSETCQWSIGHNNTDRPDLRFGNQIDLTKLNGLSFSKQHIESNLPSQFELKEPLLKFSQSLVHGIAWAHGSQNFESLQRYIIDFATWFVNSQETPTAIGVVYPTDEWPNYFEKPPLWDEFWSETRSELLSFLLELTSTVSAKVSWLARSLWSTERWYPLPTIFFMKHAQLKEIATLFERKRCELYMSFLKTQEFKGVYFIPESWIQLEHQGVQDSRLIWLRPEKVFHDRLRRNLKVDLGALPLYLGADQVDSAQLERVCEGLWNLKLNRSEWRANFSFERIAKNSQEVASFLSENCSLLEERLNISPESNSWCLEVDPRNQKLSLICEPTSLEVQALRYGRGTKQPDFFVGETLAVTDEIPEFWVSQLGLDQIDEKKRYAKSFQDGSLDFPVKIYRNFPSHKDPAFFERLKEILLKSLEQNSHGLVMFSSVARFQKFQEIILSGEDRNQEHFYFQGLGKREQISFLESQKGIWVGRGVNDVPCFNNQSGNNQSSKELSVFFDKLSDFPISTGHSQWSSEIGIGDVLEERFRLLRASLVELVKRNQIKSVAICDGRLAKWRDSVFHKYLEMIGAEEINLS